jgi:Tol biopolymer transport system component
MVFHREVAVRAGDPVRFMARPSRNLRFALTAIPGHASYSPDGNRVAYIRNNFGDLGVGSGVLIVANADGTNASPIFESDPADNLTGPAWSPRGDRIAFGTGAFFRRAGTGASRLATIGADGSSLMSLGDGPTRDGMPSWSPDGRSLVYRVADGDARGLYILDTATGARRRLETGSDRDTFPYWSPRGDWITFTSQRDGDYEIYRIRPDGTGLRRLTHESGHDAHASISPDGEWVAFSTSQQGFKDEALGFIVGARPPPFQAYGEIAVMRIDGSEVQLLTDNSVEEGVPVWVPRVPIP